MDFKSNQPIYMQIAERLTDEILAGTYQPEARVPGVREYSALLEVNVNTTVKAFDQLAQRGIIAAKRGMGYFVTAEAPQLIMEERRRFFKETAVPEFFRQMRLLNVSMEEVENAFSKFEKE